MKTLEYNGRPMRWDPINVSPERIQACLDVDEPVVVQLEPGDATRYTLMLVPSPVMPWLRGFGIPETEADLWLLVVKLASDGRRDGWAWVPWRPGAEVGTHDVAELDQNEWSQELLSWWLTECRRRLDES